MVFVVKYSDFIFPNPEYVMHGFPGPGDGVGDSKCFCVFILGEMCKFMDLPFFSAPVSGNYWTNNMTTFVWTITSPFIKLNSTVFHTLNTSGSAPRTWPQDGPSMPDPSISPTTIGDTVVIYHHGHEVHSCLPNYDGVVDYLNEIGYDVMEMNMPLFGCNSATPYGEPYDHSWFLQWEQLGDFPLRFFIEPVILTVNYAISLGYKHIVMMGLSGGGWTTTVTSAIDSRILLSIPIAGSVPKWPTTLYPYEVPDLPEIAADFEQSLERPLYAECGFVCMYILAGLENNRVSAQILHDHDPCCYSAKHLHQEIKDYNKFVQSRPGFSGWMQSYVTAGNIHEVNPRDKVIAVSLIESLRRYTNLTADIVRVQPFDIL
jgi:hypothetical protein